MKFQLPQSQTFSHYIGATGKKYVPDSNGVVTITDPTDLSTAIHAGLTATTDLDGNPTVAIVKEP